MKYIEEFIERNKTKSVITNLRKYSSLDYNGKCKTVSSLLTYFFIDKEHGIDNDEFIYELLQILNDLILCKNDRMMSVYVKWIEG